jgi:UDP-2,3-diacylglucosamine pyrophosphatase LpxH
MPGTENTPLEPGMSVRSIFISDLHLGSHFCRCEELTAFLSDHQPENLFLVGDFIDGWALQRQWHWPEIYRPLLQRIAQLADRGTRVHYTPGNHDNYLRQNLGRRQSILIHDEFVHTCADGTRLMVIHGDQFDDVESRVQWLSRVGAKVYEAMLFGDRLVGRLCRTVGYVPKPLSHRIKRGVKNVVQRVSGFERRLVAHAKISDCSGVVCGHLHRPQDRMLGSTRYINLGDWIENTSALVEHADGRLELLHWAAAVYPVARTPVGPRIVAVADQLTADLLDDLPVTQVPEVLDRYSQLVHPAASLSAIATNQLPG